MSAGSITYRSLISPQMAAISQATHSSAFSWMKTFVFWFEFHWRLFLMVQLIITQHWFRWCLGAEDATSHYPNQCLPKSLTHICGARGRWVHIVMIYSHVISMCITCIVITFLLMLLESLVRTPSLSNRWVQTWPTSISPTNCIPLRWRHNERDSVSNHQPHHCLLNRSFGRRSKKTSKLRVTGLCVGNSPVTGEFPAQMASNAENISIWWRHHAFGIIASGESLIQWEMSYHIEAETNVRHLADDIFECIFLSANFWFSKPFHGNMFLRVKLTACHHWFR